MKKKIIFLDRDGVINYDYGYVSQIDKFEFIDGVFEACKYFQKLNYEIIIVTNQSGIGRGYYNEKEFYTLTQWILDRFKEHEINILKVYFCPHSPEEKCSCRKPNIGMIENACKDFDIDLENSWLIGDKITDIQTAINANIKNYILIDSKNPDIITANNLLDTINIIIK